MPNRPDTGYGYIRRDQENIDAEETPAYRVSAFVEKPDLETAKHYLTQGDYLWNAGIFVATPEVILLEIKIHLPDLYRGLERLKSSIHNADFEREIEVVYGQIASVSFDYGIMEKTKYPLMVVPCECGWSNVGSWASLYDLRREEHDERGNLSEGDSLLIDCEGSFVSSGSGKLVACIGLKNCLVVDIPDALLVADLDKSQEVRKITETLKNAKWEKLL